MSTGPTKGEVMDRTIAQCTQCGTVYTVRKYDGTLIIPTEEGDCGCGGTAFTDVVKHHS